MGAASSCVFQAVTAVVIFPEATVAPPEAERTLAFIEQAAAVVAENRHPIETSLITSVEAIPAVPELSRLTSRVSEVAANATLSVASLGVISSITCQAGTPPVTTRPAVALSPVALGRR